MRIQGDQIYIKRTRLNPKILKQPLMALRPVMPLKTIVDQILIERQPILYENPNCNYCRDPYQRGEGSCGESAKAFNHVDHFAFTTTRASITPKDMQHSCNMHMMRMKQYKEKAMQSQATHLT